MAKDLAKPEPRRNLSAEEMQAYIDNGPGKDTDLKKDLETENLKKVKTGIDDSGEMSRLTIDLPKETHIRFKIACTRQGKKMNEEMRALVIRRIEELSEETS